MYVTADYQIRELGPPALREDFSTFFAGNYHPLTLVSLALDYRAWALNPKGYHLTNVALHVLDTIAVFAFLLLLTGSIPLAGITSLFFGIHPLHVESVAWVSGRKDLLYVLFYLGACASYVLWLRGVRPRAAFYAGTLLLFLLSLLSKGMAVTLPVALLLIDLFAGRLASRRRILLEKAPFFLLSLGFGLVAIAAQRSAGAIAEGAHASLLSRALIACHGFLFYLVKGVLPLQLSAFYPYPPAGPLPLDFWIAPVVVILLALGVVRATRHGKEILFGTLFYAVTVAPVLQLLPVGDAITADRYSYLPFVGLGFALAAGLVALWKSPLLRPGLARGFGVLVLAALGTALVFATRARCEVWRDNVTLWSDVIAKHPDVALAYTNRAKTYKERGDVALASADLERAVSLRPNDPGILVNHGNLLYIQGDRPRALADLDKAVALGPRLPDAWNSRGAVRASLGRYQEALADFDRAIELEHVFPDAYLNRANALLGMKRYDAALRDYDAYLRWEPEDARGFFCRGLARSARGEDVLAREDYGTAIRLRPGFAHAFYFRSRSYAASHETGPALQDALRARELGYPVEPGYIDSLGASAR